MSGQIPFSTLTSKYDGFYRGLVVDNNDPYKAGRCKIKVYPMMQSIDTADLPWAIPAYPIFEGSGDGIGYFSVPKVGTYVYIFFECGDIYEPVYCFEAPTKLHGVPSSALTNYPNRKVQKTTSGIEIIIDDTSKTIDMKTPGGMEIKVDDATNTLSLLHGTGAYIKISSAGQIQINGTSIMVTTNGATTWSGTGAINVTSSGAVTVSGSSVSINP